jgi:hypothetical protein
LPSDDLRFAVGFFEFLHVFEWLRPEAGEQHALPMKIGLSGSGFGKPSASAA